VRVGQRGVARGGASRKAGVDLIRLQSAIEGDVAKRGQACLRPAPGTSPLMHHSRPLGCLNNTTFFL
jgi:hypothetical protein